MNKPKYRYEISAFHPSGAPKYDIDFLLLVNHIQAVHKEQISVVDNRLSVGYTETDIIRLVQIHLAGLVTVRFVDEQRCGTKLTLVDGKIKN